MSLIHHDEGQMDFNAPFRRAHRGIGPASAEELLRSYPNEHIEQTILSCLGNSDLNRTGEHDISELREHVSIIAQHATEGDAAAQYRLGCCYRDGCILPKDAKLATKWFKLAADQGHAEAAYQLGTFRAKPYKSHE